MKSKRIKRFLESGFLSLICAGSLFGIYLFSIGPVMLGAAILESSASNSFSFAPTMTAIEFYKPWWWIRSNSPAPVRFLLDEHTELWFREP